MSSEWFKDWFETEEYLNVYQHRNEIDAGNLVNLIINNVNIPGNSKVLDMACGTGRHSLLFAKRGYDVTAVDLSRRMLSVAQLKSEKENLNINFIQSDLRYFSYSGSFDLILNLFTSFGYFETDQENFLIFHTAFDHLNFGGYFIIDYFNNLFIENNLVHQSEDRIGNTEVIQHRKIDGSRVVKNISIKKNGATKNYFESVRMYSPVELANELTRIGFVIEKTFGDFHGNKFDQYLSPRIIFIAKK